MLHDLTYPEIKLLQRGPLKRDASRMRWEVEDGLVALFVVCKTERKLEGADREAEGAAAAAGKGTE